MPQLERPQRDGTQVIELTCNIFWKRWAIRPAKAAFRSMNAAKIMQHAMQQMPSIGCPTADPDHRKFHCVFKDSRAR
jgi:hypothetical protein